MTAQDWLSKDYYSVLDVARDCSDDTLKRAYRRLTRLHHPDANAGCPQAADRFKEIGVAYAVLSDHGRRAQYDRAHRPLRATSAAGRTRPGAAGSSGAGPDTTRPSPGTGPTTSRSGGYSPGAGAYAGGLPVWWSPTMWSAAVWSTMARSTAPWPRQWPSAAQQRQSAAR